MRLRFALRARFHIGLRALVVTVAHLVLVRLVRFLAPMAALLVTWIVSSCAHVIVVGPQQTSISRAERDEIRSLVSRRADIRSGVLFLRPLTRDRIAVQSGSSGGGDGTRYHTFTVVRERGRWTVDEASISSSLIIVTD